jgi:hypothetical protein
MKASDVQELQRKLQKLQFELRQAEVDDEEEAEVPREEDYILEKIQEHKKKDTANRKLTIDDFDIYTTLGKWNNLHKLILKVLEHLVESDKQN